jgi:hypothetical protein
VTRGTPATGQSVGPIVLIDNTAINAPETTTSSYNVEIDYALLTQSLGKWQFAAIANFWQHYRIQSAIGGAFVEQLGNPYVTASGTGAGLAKFKGNASLEWSKGPFSLGWLVRYIGPYNDGAANGLGGVTAYRLGTTDGWVSGQIYHDAYAEYRFGRSSGGPGWQRVLMNNSSVRVGVKNLFNRIPPYDGVNSIGLWDYSTYGDVRMANYYVALDKRF